MIDRANMSAKELVENKKLQHNFSDEKWEAIEKTVEVIMKNGYRGDHFIDDLIRCMNTFKYKLV